MTIRQLTNRTALACTTALLVASTSIAAPTVSIAATTVTVGASPTDAPAAVCGRQLDVASCVALPQCVLCCTGPKGTQLHRDGFAQMASAICREWPKRVPGEATGTGCPTGSHAAPPWARTCEDVCPFQRWCETCNDVPWCGMNITSGTCTERGGATPDQCPKDAAVAPMRLAILDVLVSIIWSVIAALCISTAITGLVVALRRCVAHYRQQRARREAAEQRRQRRQARRAAAAAAAGGGDSAEAPLLGEEDDEPSRASLATGDDEIACGICMARRATVVFLPCHHTHACRGCASRLSETESAVTCPYCRVPVVHMVHVGVAGSDGKSIVSVEQTPRPDPAAAAPALGVEEARCDSGGAPPPPGAPVAAQAARRVAADVETVAAESVAEQGSPLRSGGAAAADSAGEAEEVEEPTSSVRGSGNVQEESRQRGWAVEEEEAVGSDATDGDEPVPTPPIGQEEPAQD